MIACRSHLSPEVPYPAGFHRIDWTNVPGESPRVANRFQKGAVSSGVTTVIIVHQEMRQAPAAQLVLVDLGIHLRATFAGQQHFQGDRHVARGGGVSEPPHRVSGRIVERLGPWAAAVVAREFRTVAIQDDPELRRGLWDRKQACVGGVEIFEGFADIGCVLGRCSGMDAVVAGIDDDGPGRDADDPVGGDRWRWRWLRLSAIPECAISGEPGDGNRRQSEQPTVQVARRQAVG